MTCPRCGQAMTAQAHRHRVRFFLALAIVFTIAFYLGDYTLFFESYEHDRPQLVRLFSDPGSLSLMEWLAILFCVVFCIMVGWLKIRDPWRKRCPLCGQYWERQ